ncbi:MAG: glycosyltransferase family 2 protein [Proteobacteria bacterium]|nr:glycosyltransferase family 2 protein [Pseudomonadota bacterium]MBU4132615.1 glycosyltransferase family 2 protein [Pseudomonadota bacterium]
MKFISIVIVSYHTGPVLFESISSVLAQEETGQLILVNNGNPNSVVDALQGKFGSDKRFELISGHGNIGFSKACNLAAKKVASEFVFFLNPDCIIPDKGIAKLFQAAESCEGDYLLAPRLVNSDGTDQQGARREILTPWIAFVEGVKLYKIIPGHPYFRRFDHHDQPLPTKVTEIPVTSGACMFLKTAFYRSLGGMDEGYFLHVEDIDFCLRLRKAGGKIYFCPDVTFVHTLGTSDASRLFVEFHKLNGFRRYFQLHFSKVYPPGFVGLVNCLLMIRFGCIAVKESVISVVRSVRHKN